jgi:hypothetical protein
MGFSSNRGTIAMVQSMKRPIQIWVPLLVSTLLLVAIAPFNSAAKSYSSGSHSYSSHSSGGSHSFSSGGGHSFSSSRSSSGSSSHHSSVSSSHSSSGGNSHSSTGGKSSSGGGSKSSSFSSGSGHSYSSGSTWSNNGRHSYTSAKSYSSGAGNSFVSHILGDSAGTTTKTARKSQSDSSHAPFDFDSTAARARKEEASQAKFNQYKDARRPPPIAMSDTPPLLGDAPSYRVQPPPLTTPGGTYSRTADYVPDRATISTRPIRIYNVFNPYRSRPWVVYRDPYDSLFWWWLLDRSLDDRAWWAYHHRYDMDPARYQALLATDQQLEARVEQLEAQQPHRDANYVPPGLDRDLMYSEQYVAQTYSNRPTTLGVIVFWALGVPTALAFTGFFIWLIWFKRWQTAS